MASRFDPWPRAVAVDTAVALSNSVTVARGAVEFVEAVPLPREEGSKVLHRGDG